MNHKKELLSGLRVAAEFRSIKNVHVQFDKGSYDPPTKLEAY